MSTILMADHGTATAMRVATGGLTAEQSIALLAGPTFDEAEIKRKLGL